MRLIDTSAWIEWLVASDSGERLAEYMPERRDWLVPTIVQLELAKWLQRAAGDDKADQVIAFTQLCVLAPLDTPIALAAAEMYKRLKLTSADAIIYAKAQAYSAELITCDAHFEGLKGLTYIAKSPG